MPEADFIRRLFVESDRTLVIPPSSRFIPTEPRGPVERSASSRRNPLQLQKGTPEVLEALCRRLTESDRQAFEQVFRILRDDLVRYARSIVRDDAVAHDLVQDVFLSLWETRATLDPTLSLKAFLYRMSRNAAYRHLRDTRTHARKHVEIQRNHEQWSLNGSAKESTLDAEQLSRRLRQWINELPERQREALTLSRYHGLSHREIASLMQISPRTVNNHIMRALEHLHEKVQLYEPALFRS